MLQDEHPKKVSFDLSSKVRWKWVKGKGVGSVSVGGNCRYRGTKAETIGLLWDAISISE